MADLSKNTIPEDVSRIHLIAICGTGMGALGCMLKDLGYQVTGSDRNVYPPMSDFLAQKGITVTDGFSGSNISYGPDLVVVGNAVTRDNQEILRMQQMGLHFCSMPQAVNRFVAEGKKQILVTGTHGKTTTSSIIAWILHAAGFDPSFLIGGILKNFDSNYRLGNGDYIVIEGDEYDTAFFDKGPKFLHYDPHMAVVTSIEFDHADIFRNLDHILEAFNNFISGISKESTLFAFDGEANIAKLLDAGDCRIEKYGSDSKSNWRLGSISTGKSTDKIEDKPEPKPMHNTDKSRTQFEVIKNGEAFKTFSTPLMGRHNLLNALACIAVSDGLGIQGKRIARALETFQGVKRRQEIRGEKRDIRVIDDFAHHPTAVRETIKAVKPSCTGGRLVAVFEPRTNTSMRNIFQDVYPLSFDQADVVCIRKPPLLKKIPLQERFSSEKLVDDLNRRGKSAHYFPDTDSIIDFLTAEANPGDTILIMSNGGFDNIHERLLESL
jgi:UDP-N-acetylmuramate: L-alanyl-gamma-D-glutamyl-meso-diaminopimelate ligase